MCTNKHACESFSVQKIDYQEIIMTRVSMKAREKGLRIKSEGTSIAKARSDREDDVSEFLQPRKYAMHTQPLRWYNPFLFVEQLLL